MLSPEIVRAVRDRAPRVVVVGDLIMDGWWRGRSERLSREAPAPVVEVDERQEAPGGAANAAMNLAALGARVRLVGAVGADEAGVRLGRRLRAAGVSIRGVLTRSELATVTKVRICSDDQILLRVDEGGGASSPDLADALADALVAALDGADALLIGSYGAAALPDAVERAVRRAGRPPHVVVDAHDLSRWRRLEPDVVTPNAAEAYGLLGSATPDSTGQRADALADQWPALHAATGAAAVALTLDRDGALLLTEGAPAYRTWGRPAPERQASGAGDTFAAALTAGLAGGLDQSAAMELGQAAADVVVQRFGTSVCSADDLLAQLERPAAQVLDAAALAERVAADRAAGRRIVLTNGCFDVLHRGHTAALAAAARLGDVLVVAVNSDDSIRRLKGPDRPINTAADRAAVLAALSDVDYVTVFATDTPIPLLELLRPEVYTKGGDYSPEMLAEAEVVRGYGGDVRIVAYVPEQSTTRIVDRIRTPAPTAVTPSPLNPT